MPPVKEEYAVSISQGTFKSMIRQCIFASAQDESKPILTGVLLEMRPESLRMVALDGYRLALRQEPLLSGREDKDAVIPARSLMEIGRMLEEREDLLKVIFSATHVMIDMGHTKVTTRLLDGEFIRYRQILPDGQTTRAQVDRQELLDSIERVSLMAREGKKNHIRFSFQPECLTLSANSEIGFSTEEIAINLTGNPLDIAFNARYFSDVLKALEDEALMLDMNNNISPAWCAPSRGTGSITWCCPCASLPGICKLAGNGRLGKLESMKKTAWFRLFLAVEKSGASHFFDSKPRRKTAAARIGIDHFLMRLRRSSRVRPNSGSFFRSAMILL